MGKTRDFFKKTSDTKGTFHAKMGTIQDKNSMDLKDRNSVDLKDRNSMDLTETENMKKRWQE